MLKENIVATEWSLLEHVWELQEIAFRLVKFKFYKVKLYKFWLIFNKICAIYIYLIYKHFW